MFDDLRPHRHLTSGEIAVKCLPISHKKKIRTKLDSTARYIPHAPKRAVDTIEYPWYRAKYPPGPREPFKRDTMSLSRGNWRNRWSVRAQNNKVQKANHMTCTSLFITTLGRCAKVVNLGICLKKTIMVDCSKSELFMACSTFICLGTKSVILFFRW